MKEKIVTVRLAPDVLQSLKRLADDKGLRLSAYIRMKLMDSLKPA